MNGTAWTEPGQGATVDELFRAAYAITNSHNKTSDVMLKLGRTLGKDPRWIGGPARWSPDDFSGFLRRTNLSLTGALLTAEDLKRIATCEVRLESDPKPPFLDPHDDTDTRRNPTPHDEPNDDPDDDDDTEDAPGNELSDADDEARIRSHNRNCDAVCVC